ncbi:YwqG family protein [Hymenobacter sp. YC55]|uniref:YwqG family protein n=1 Tax=Hymenobacter sp. YC55 TaxID=3034019 RepID=UPI0023F9A7F2|nr:YwqG family protein [Hymenobacter sp. YC55]MDF7811877.1 YwqG family protein [Hymenobacter sp. YC55]
MIPEFLQPFADQLEHYKLESIKIKATPLDADQPASAASKFRGLPHLPASVPYPLDNARKPMLLLAQINLQELPSNTFLPAAGLLQFYVATHDWYDMDQSAVLYLSPEQLQEEARQDYSFLPADHYDDSPIDCEHQLTFARAVEYGSAHDHRFGLEFNGLDSYEYAETLPEAEQKIFQQFLDGDGHKLGGYAAFTQGDPRENDSTSNQDVQLLQIDADEKIMFGDSGVAHFFIAEQALKEGRFEEAYFYWDCY